MTERVEEKRNPLSWLTIEIALYGVVLMLALALRLGGLQIRVMDVPEANQAWQAWRLARVLVKASGRGLRTPAASVASTLFALISVTWL